MTGKFISLSTWIITRQQYQVMSHMNKCIFHWMIFQNDSSICLKYVSSLQLALIKIIFVVMFDSSHYRCNFKINYSYISSKKAKLAAKNGKTMRIAFLHSLHALYTLLLPFSGRHLVLFCLSIPIDYFYSTIISCISIE